MGKARAAFWRGPEVDMEADAWQAAAERTNDSWWEHWTNWVLERSNGTREAPAEPGNSKYQPIVPAPGRYVHGE